MIKDIKIWEEFEKDLIRNEKPDFEKNIKIFNELRRQALTLKAVPPIDLLEDLESKVKISKTLNNLK